MSPILEPQNQPPLESTSLGLHQWWGRERYNIEDLNEDNRIITEEINKLQHFKANINGQITEGDFDEIPTGFYRVATTHMTNTPLGNTYFSGSVFTLTYGSYSYQEAFSHHTRNLYTRTKGGGIWSKWIEIATKETPKEFDLPITNDFRAAFKSFYFKSQENIVTLSFALMTSDRTDKILQHVVLATLPEGYRPKNQIQIPINCYSTVNTSFSGHGFIKPTGEITVWSSTTTPVYTVHANASFLAVQ